jgi:hypothetical protein
MTGSLRRAKPEAAILTRVLEHFHPDWKTGGSVHCHCEEPLCDAAIRGHTGFGSDCRVAKRLLAMTARRYSIFIHGVGRRRTVFTRNDNRAFPVNVKVFQSAIVRG